MILGPPPPSLDRFNRLSAGLLDVRALGNARVAGAGATSTSKGDGRRASGTPWLPSIDRAHTTAFFHEVTP